MRPEGYLLLLGLFACDRVPDDTVPDDTDADGDTDADTDSDTDSDTDTDTDSDTDADTDSDTDSDTDTDTDTDADAPADALVVGDLLITEIMRNPDAVDDAFGEWFELRNASAGEIDLDGLILTEHGGSPVSVSVSGTLLVPAGDYVVFGLDANSATNGGNTEVDYVFADLSLANGDDALVIANASGTLDEVIWLDATFPDEKGRSMQLDPAVVTVEGNDDAEGWCAARVAYGDGDSGTPGAENPGCDVGLTVGDLAPGDLIVTEILQDSATVADEAGEWFEILNGTDRDVDLEGLVVQDDGGYAFTVAGTWILAAGDYAVFGVDADSSANDGVAVDYDWGSDADFALGEGADQVVLSNGAVEIDRVDYDASTFPYGEGYSMTLDPTRIDDTANDIGTNWCAATSLYGADNHGTPGAANDGC